jgi:Outer membrane lipoprotein-sorting protein
MIKTSRIIPTLLFVLLTPLFYSHSINASGTQDILRKADQSRGNLEGITWKVILAHTDTRAETMNFDVKARGFDILAENLAPPKDRGNKVLMVNGNMWFHKPGLSKPVPISQRQRLMGNAAYGDIAATNYAEDYQATPLADEKVNGELCYVFDLNAKDNRAAYDRIKYWISKERVVGVKAEYFTVSGKMFKSASMDSANTVKINDEVRPFISKITIYDELLSSNVTTLSLTKPTFRKLASYMFDVNLLVK